MPGPGPSLAGRWLFVWLFCSTMNPVHYTMKPTERKVHNSQFWRRLIQAAPKAELEQSILRVAIPAVAAVVLLCIWAWNGTLSDGQVRGLAIAIAFFVFAATITLHIVLRGEKTNVRARRILGIVSDNAVNTYFMFVMDEGGAIVFGVYLFVTFGNGFRYGRFYLHLSQVFSVLGFCAVLGFSPFWSQHPFVGAGILIALLVLPFYVGVLAQRITEAKQRADEANRAKDRFLANVSHEMRTPLNGVIAMADLLRETTLDMRQADMVDTLATSAQLALKQVEDVLNAAKIEAGRVQAIAKPFDLAKLVEDTVKVVLPQATYKGIQVNLELDSREGMRFVGDSRLIQQIVLNLLANAVKFTDKGSVTVRVKQAAGALNGESPVPVRLEVQDTGIGIAQEKLSTIFEAFAQADDSITRVYGGTGLGTTIARQLTRLMGGSIGVESTPGIGSLFWVEIPLAPCDTSVGEHSAEAIATDRPAKALNATSPAPLRGARVLVAEDNPTNQRVTELILASRGHHCTIVSNGEEALDALEQDQFDVALLDLSMPILSGLDVLKAYRFLATQPIPVLILSANVTSELIEASIQAGAAEFVSKPIRASTLLDAIEMHLAGSTSARLQISAAVDGNARKSQKLRIVDTSILDESVLAEISKMTTDPTFLHRLLRGFQEDCERLVRELSESLSAGRIESARDAAHALKGGAGGVGAFALMHIAARIETFSNDECTQMAPELRRNLEECTKKTLDAIMEKLGGGPKPYSSKPTKHQTTSEVGNSLSTA